MRDSGPMKVVLLAGGVGGAKMAEGLATIPNISLSIIGNVADDEAFHGLWVSPDIDTLTYSLAGMIDRAKGWGVADEGDRALETLRTLGEDTWMFLGDRDFGLHIHRTMRRARGERPFTIAQDVAKAFGVRVPILLPTDDNVQTQVLTDAGWIGFQTYFVREKCAPEVKALRFDGLDEAKPTAEALAVIEEADVIILAPSNPLVSIGPILAIPGMREAMQKANAKKIAVSPLIAGKVVKGPADRMMTSLGLRADALGIAEHYQDLIDSLFIDEIDAHLSDAITGLGIRPVCEAILMKDLADKEKLATALLAHAAILLKDGVAA